MKSALCIMCLVLFIDTTDNFLFDRLRCILTVDDRHILSVPYINFQCAWIFDVLTAGNSIVPCHPCAYYGDTLYIAALASLLISD